jgi:hypothetical protein
MKDGTTIEYSGYGFVGTPEKLNFIQFIPVDNEVKLIATNNEGFIKVVNANECKVVYANGCKGVPSDNNALLG